MIDDNNIKLKKINWFKRLFIRFILPFLPWNWLSDYFKKNCFSHNNQLNEEIKKSNEIIVANVGSNISNKINELIQKNNESNNLRNEIEKLKDQKQQIEKELIKTQSELESKKTNNFEKDNVIKSLNEKINEYMKEIAKVKTIDKIESWLAPGIKTLKNMDDYFFQKGGKGLSILHENLVESIILKAKLPEETYKKPLIFINKDRVEFALNSGDNKHWIPVDAKAYIPDKKGPDGQYIIDASFISKIKKGAKEMIKYLNRNEENSSTTYYGLLVTISDEIYSNTCNKFMTDINNIRHEYKIIVCSPTNFIQFSWFLQNNLQLIEKYKNYDQTIHNCNELVREIEKFMKKITEIKNNFDTICTKTYPKINHIKEKIYPQLTISPKNN